MEETLFDEIFDEVNSTLKYNGLTPVTDVDSKKRVELALEIATSVIELIEKRANPPKAVPASQTIERRHFKSDTGALWATVNGGEIVRYERQGGKIVGKSENDIYETVDNLANCVDVVEIDESEFQKLLKNMAAPF